MPPTLADRLGHILVAIATIQDSLANKTQESFASDIMLRAGVERLLEIISEASRHIPADVKTAETAIRWQRMADLGNLLRHAYHRSDTKIIWDIVEHDLTPLRAFVERIVSESES